MRCLVWAFMVACVAAGVNSAAAQFHRPHDSGRGNSGSTGDRAGGGTAAGPVARNNEQSKGYDASRYQIMRPSDNSGRRGPGSNGSGGYSHHAHRPSYYGGNTYNFYYGSGYSYAPYADPYGVGLVDPYWSGPLVLPPLVIPAETMFGPQIARNMLGPDLPVTLPTVTRMPRVRGPVEVKVTNAEVKARAGRFMEIGDTHFKAQRFREAVERYRTAAQTAPDVPIALLRQGAALVAMSQYESAAKVMRRALQVRSDWTESEPFLAELYGEHGISKAAHLEALAKAVDANEQDADLLFLLAMELYFDGQRQRATPFFERSAQLDGNEDHLLDAFLPPRKAAKAAVAAGKAAEF